MPGAQITQLPGYIPEVRERLVVRVADATDGHELEMKSEYMPEWFKTALWSRFDGVESDDAGPQHAG